MGGQNGNEGENIFDLKYKKQSTGHPWWPSIIQSVDQENHRYHVYFLADQMTNANVKFNQVVEYEVIFFAGNQEIEIWVPLEKSLRGRS